MANNVLYEVGGLDMDNFVRISSFIQEHYGIQLPLTKKKMVEARLQKRLKACGIATFEEYFDFVFDEKGRGEYTHMIDLITTNKTEFFREPAHFDFLTDNILPELISKKEARSPIKIWSAAASTGEEVYSIAISLREYFLKTFKTQPYQILGTDLSFQVLKKAATGIYAEDRISLLPLTIKKRYFLKGKDPENPRARVKPELTRSIAFKQLNLLKSLDGIERNFDVIFCRNVLIYFNRQVQEEVINKLLKHLNPGGYILIGHSESLMNMHLPLKQIRPTIYKKSV